MSPSEAVANNPLGLIFCHTHGRYCGAPDELVPPEHGHEPGDDAACFAAVIDSARAGVLTVADMEAWSAEPCYGLSSVTPHELGTRAADCPECPDWTAYRKCSTCGAPTGTACASRSGRIVEGQPDGKRTPLPRPHVARQRRTGR